MKRLTFKVGGVFEMPDARILISSDSKDFEQVKTGDKIEIQNDNGQSIITVVTGVVIENGDIALGENIKKSDIEIGAKVYKIDNLFK